MMKFSDREENIVGKGENAGYQHFLLFQQCLQESLFPKGASKVGIVRLKVKKSYKTSIDVTSPTKYCFSLQAERRKVHVHGFIFFFKDAIYAFELIDFASMTADMDACRPHPHPPFGVKCKIQDKTPISVLNSHCQNVSSLLRTVTYCTYAIYMPTPSLGPSVCVRLSSLI